MHLIPGSGVLARTTDLRAAGAPDDSGALWRLHPVARQLDANLIRLPPGAGVPWHTEEDVDVLLYVTDGHGRLRTEQGWQDLEPGCLAWLPHGTTREMAAGGDGLTYLTVHRRRAGMTIAGASAAAASLTSATRTREPEGGEAACALHRVCPACARPAAEADARYCSRCGEALPTG